MHNAPKSPRKPSGRPRRHIPGDQLLEWRRQGLSFRQIARKTGCGYGTVRRAYLASQEMETVAGS